MCWQNIKVYEKNQFECLTVLLRRFQVLKGLFRKQDNVGVKSMCGGVRQLGE